jgi:hypothetical protein
MDLIQPPLVPMDLIQPPLVPMDLIQPPLVPMDLIQPPSIGPDGYGWIPHNASFGFLDKARAKLGQIHF